MRPIHAVPGRPRGVHATLLAAIVAPVLAGCAGRAEPARVPPPPTVTVVSARNTDVPIVVRGQGTTRAINDVTIRARVTGFLTERHFTEGTDVKAGQLLLVIDEEPYRVKLEQAKATLAEAEASLKKAEQSKDREVALAQLHVDEAQFALDQVEERRERTLLSRNASTIEDVDRRQATLKKTAALVESDRAQLEQTRADHDTNILAARAKVEQARAAVREAEIELGYCRMVAPIGGRIGELKFKIGDLVGPDKNTDLVTLQQLDPMGVDLNPPARYLPVINRLVKQGLFIDLAVEGERQHPHQAKVYFIDNTVESTTGTFLMKASVPNPDQSLLPGEYVGVKARVGDYRGVVVVPEKAVIEGQAGPTVYVVDQSGRASVVGVKPLDTYRGMRVIESGLEPGQRVIVEGIQLVRPGQAVKVEEVPLERFERDEADSSDADKYESPAFQGRSEPAPGAGARPAGEAGPASPPKAAPAGPRRP